MKESGLSDIQIESKTRNTPGGSHAYLINELFTILNKKNNSPKDFNTNIIALKKIRVDADYMDKMIDSSIEGKAKILTDKILGQLKTI